MDAMDILGDLLGQKTSKPGRGTDILKDIFGRGSRRSAPSNKSGSSPGTRTDINREAEELEDLLNVAKGRSANRSRPSPPRRQQPRPIPQKTSPPPRNTDADRMQSSENDRALALIRAMINSAKADGRIDADEQEKIIGQIDHPSPESIDFLRKEFAAPLDIAKFVLSIPIGMEQQVYTMSLIAIDLDERAEANYLEELAQWLRIPTNVREQIHHRLRAPATR